MDKSHLKKILEYAVAEYESEMERAKGVETKSSLFIGTTSIIVSVVIGVTSTLFKVDELNFIMILFLSLLLLLVIVYMSRTIWFSIKALERKYYYVISIDDFLVKEESCEEYYKTLIVKIREKIIKNAKVINNKVDNMTMAQEYFKRSIIVIVIYSFAMIISASFLYWVH